jgi:hypothetical protein
MRGRPSACALATLLAALPPAALLAVLPCKSLLAALPAPALLAARPAAALDWREPWVPLHDGAQALSSSDEYAWRLFVALNWPADAKARAADRHGRFGEDRPVVWETWRNTSDVFLENGADPGPWDGAPPDVAPPDVAPPDGAPRESGVASERRFESLSPADFSNLRHIVGGVMVPVEEPLLRAARLIEVRMNRASFEYVRAHELYNLDGQLQAVREHLHVQFPQGSIQVKASWRPIDAEQKSRYHTLTVRLGDGATRLYGLTALNIASKDLPNWFWASFEHVDNATRTDGDGWQAASRDAFACRNASPDCNRAPAGVGLEATVWQHYRLRGTLTSYLDDSGAPRLLGNSELEAGLQRTASCMTCHSRSSLGFIDGRPVRLSVFDKRADTPGNEALARRGYVGLPNPAWFDGADGERASYRPLDFVWSLSQARPKAAPNDGVHP